MAEVTAWEHGEVLGVVWGGQGGRQAAGGARGEGAAERLVVMACSCDKIAGVRIQNRELIQHKSSSCIMHVNVLSGGGYPYSTTPAVLSS